MAIPGLYAARMSNVHVVEHPVVAHLLATLRDKATPPDRFRAVIAQLGGLLAYEATRDLAVREVQVDTPLERMGVQRLARPVSIVPILRAGLGLAEGMLRVVPEAQVGHIGMFRDEDKLKPVSYYDKLPPSAPSGTVLLADPMLATGGSAIAALELLRSHGCDDITFVCVLASPEGLQAIERAGFDVPIVTAAIDRQLDDRGYILPGLGDAGDRTFGTLEN
jgi:uracil phosphoribosyltransferase